jgi:RNA polymerase primary sigma factor
VGTGVVLPDAVSEVVARLRQNGVGSGLIPAQAVATAATASGLAPENIDDIVRALADSGVEVVVDEPSPADIAKVAAQDEEDLPSLDDSGPAASADLVRVYLREIGRVPLLTAELEVELARRVEAGVFAAEQLADAVVITLDLRNELALIAADGELAKKPAHRSEPAPRRVDRQALRRPRHGAARPDPRGQPRPDPCRREVRLHEGLQVLDVRDVVDPPGHHPRDRRPGPHDPHPGAHGRDDEQGAAHLRVQMLQELGREPTVEEIAAKVELTPDQGARDPAHRAGAGVARDAGRRRGRQLPRRLRRRPQRDRAGDGRGARVALEAIEEALQELNPREQQVVRLRFGLDDGQIRTLEEVGREFGVTRERIRQIESKTLAKLREPGLLPETVHERVTSTILLSRHLLVSGRQGLSVVARRQPGSQDVEWQVVADAGVDPADPQVSARVDEAVRAMSTELGLR